MSLQKSDVTRIAQLAQLELSPDQLGVMLEKLNGIFALVEKMQSINTDGVQPLTHPFTLVADQLSLRLREDQVTETNQRATYQQYAPAVQDGLYLVPKVIE